MGRLFWKFFFFFWITQLAAILIVTASFWLEHRDENGHRRGGPPGGMALNAAAAVLRYGGIDGLRELLRNDPRGGIYALDGQDREILGRAIAPAQIAQIRRADKGKETAYGARIAHAADGRSYLLFEARPPEMHGPPPHGDRPPPGKYHLPIEPLIVAMLTSLLSAGVLAWYVAKPIRNLRSAFEAAAAGDLQVSPGRAMDGRRDELADLGRDFDRMAGQLRNLMEGQRRLLHDVSHEMRTPLARLQAAIGLAHQQPEKFDASLARIQLEAERIDKLVGELLTLSRLNAGVGATKEEEIDLADLIADIVEDANFEAEAQGCRVETAQTAPLILRGRPELLHRAIENLVRNAVLYTPAGGKVTLEAGCIDGGLRIAVLDNGPGVPVDELDKIFKPFFRGAGAKSGAGHGLGLAIAQRIVASHGGTVRAANRPGGGLCVEIILPMKSA